MHPFIFPFEVLLLFVPFRTNVFAHVSITLPVFVLLKGFLGNIVILSQLECHSCNVEAACVTCVLGNAPGFPPNMTFGNLTVSLRGAPVTSVYKLLW